MTTLKLKVVALRRKKLAVTGGFSADSWVTLQPVVFAAEAEAGSEFDLPLAFIDGGDRLRLGDELFIFVGSQDEPGTPEVSPV